LSMGSRKKLNFKSNYQLSLGANILSAFIVLDDSFRILSNSVATVSSGTCTITLTHAGEFDSRSVL
jgi:putative Mn2+ efflux pump MntP